jgi:hypothetical protein
MRTPSSAAVASRAAILPTAAGLPTAVAARSVRRPFGGRAAP